MTTNNIRKCMRDVFVNCTNILKENSKRMESRNNPIIDIGAKCSRPICRKKRNVYLDTCIQMDAYKTERINTNSNRGKGSFRYKPVKSGSINITTWKGFSKPRKSNGIHENDVTNKFTQLDETKLQTPESCRNCFKTEWSIQQQGNQTRQSKRTLRVVNTTTLKTTRCDELHPPSTNVTKRTYHRTWYEYPSDTLTRSHRKKTAKHRHHLDQEQQNKTLSSREEDEIRPKDELRKKLEKLKYECAQMQQDFNAACVENGEIKMIKSSIDQNSSITKFDDMKNRLLKHKKLVINKSRRPTPLPSYGDYSLKSGRFYDAHSSD